MLIAVPPQVTENVVSTVTVAIVGGLTVVLTPILTNWMNNRSRRQDKKQDWDRQDAVAKAALDAAAMVAVRAQDAVEKSAQIAKDILRANTQTAEVTKTNSAKLDQIHTLVNGNLTSALEDQLAARRENLALLRTQFPSPEITDMIEATVAKIADLEVKLADRQRQTVAAADQLAIDLSKVAH